MSSSSMLMVALAGGAMVLAWTRGWFKSDGTGSPVIEAVHWRPVKNDELTHRWKRVGTEHDGCVALLGREVEFEPALGMAACVLIAIVVLVVPDDLKGSAAGYGRLGGFVAFLLVAWALFRLGTIGLYLSDRGAMVVGVRAQVLRWDQVDRFEVARVHHDRAEQVAVVSRSGSRWTVPMLARQKGFADKRLPVGPGRWKLHAFEELVEQLNELRSQVVGS